MLQNTVGTCMAWSLKGEGVMPVRQMKRGNGWGWAVAFAVLLGLSGCGSMAPAYERPGLPVPMAYADGVARADAASVADLPWQDYFTDPTLRRLLAQALAHNRDLRTAVLRVQEARVALGMQRAERLPTVGASLEGTRAQVPHDLNLTGRSLLGNQFQGGVGFSSWEIDLWGRLASLNEAAMQSYLASDAARHAVTVGVLTQTANGYLSLRELDERLALARRAAASREESLRIFRRREALGATSKLELTQVELLWQQAQALVSQLALARATQAHALAVLVGEPVPDDLAPMPLADMPPLAELQPGVPSDLLLQRPDIVAAEHALRAANAHIGAARAAFFPRIALTASYGTASTELEGLFQAGSAAWTFVPSIGLPLFDGGRREAALDLAQLRREGAVVRYEQAVEGAFRDVSDALAARRWLGEQVRTLQATQALQAERARLAKLRYDSGAARYLEVLDAERDVLTLEQQLVQTRRAQLSAQVALYAALGGGVPRQALERPERAE